MQPGDNYGVFVLKCHSLRVLDKWGYEFFLFLFVCVTQIHLKNRELENTKLSAELQMLRSVDVNKENTIAQLKEELARAKSCLAEKDKQHRQLLANSSPSVI